MKNLLANAGDKERLINPWVGEIPWSRTWQPPPVFLPGESPWTIGTWWATVCRIAKSQTRLKRLSTHAARTGLRWGCLRWHLLGNIWEQEPPKLPISHDFFPDFALCSAQNKACIDLFGSQP